MPQFHRARVALFSLVVALLVPSCFLFRPSSSPEKKACNEEAWKSRPQLEGAWETKDGARIDIRHSPSTRAGLDVAIAADSASKPEWTVERAGLRTPEMKSENPPVCGDTWTVALRLHFAGRTAEPGQMVNLVDSVTARIASADRIELSNGDVWTRVGAVGACR